MLVQGILRLDPFCGHLFVFRGRKANLIKIVYWDGTGLCLFTKRLEQRCLPVAAKCRAGRNAHAEPGAVVDAHRRCRLACDGAAMAAGGGGLTS